MEAWHPDGVRRRAVQRAVDAGRRAARRPGRPRRRALRRSCRSAVTRALSEAGLNPAEVFLTNAVKHFKWEARGKRRIHEKPNREEVLACRLWLDEEIDNVRPAMIVALGATAAGTLLGSRVKVTRDRGKFFESTLAPVVSLTVHPSSILRAPDSAARKSARAAFVKDLKTFARKLGRTP